jgi:hypothetical protein
MYILLSASLFQLQAFLPAHLEAKPFGFHRLRKLQSALLPPPNLPSPRNIAPVLQLMTFLPVSTFIPPSFSRRICLVYQLE